MGSDVELHGVDELAELLQDKLAAVRRVAEVREERRQDASEVRDEARRLALEHEHERGEALRVVLLERRVAQHAQQRAERRRRVVRLAAPRLRARALDRVRLRLRLARLLCFNSGLASTVLLLNVCS